MKMYILSFNRMGKALLLNPKTLEIYSTNSDNVKNKGEYVWIIESITCAFAIEIFHGMILSSQLLFEQYIFILASLFSAYYFALIYENLFQIKIKKKNITEFHNLQEKTDTFWAEKSIEANIDYFKKQIHMGKKITLISIIAALFVIIIDGFSFMVNTPVPFYLVIIIIRICNSTYIINKLNKALNYISSNNT